MIRNSFLIGYEKLPTLVEGVSDGSEDLGRKTYLTEYWCMVGNKTPSVRSTKVNSAAAVIGGIQRWVSQDWSLSIPIGFSGHPHAHTREPRKVAPSVPNRPGAWQGPVGGLPRAPDGTGRLSVVRPGRLKSRTVVFGQDGGPYRVRHVSSGQGFGRQGMARDGR